MRSASTLLAAILLAAPAWAQEEPPSAIYVDDDEAKPLLDAAEKYEKQGRWDEAIERYQKVLRQHPDQMRAVGSDGKTWKSVRRHIFEKIAKFPPAGRQAYLTMNDAMAKSLFEQARRERDLSELERVANEYFFTSAGDDASALLADIYAEHGRLQDAMYYWERLATLYPEPDVEMAPVLAKWAVACRRTGHEPGWLEAKNRLLALKDAGITAGGKKTTAAELAVALEALQPEGARAERDDEWPRLGGNNAGSRVTKAWARNDVRMWAFPERTLEEAQNHVNAVRNVSRSMGLQIPFVHAYPAVSAGGIAVIADGQSVWVMDIQRGGDLLWAYPKGADPKGMFEKTMVGQARLISMVAPVISEGVAYVNFLPATVQFQQPGGTCLRAFRLEDGAELWSTAGDEALAELWFGTPPVVYGGRVFAAAATSAAQDSEAHLVILDARTGKLVRKIFLCSKGGGGNMWAWNGGFGEAPTIAESGGLLYVNTNVGAVACVHGCTGEILWLQAYADPPPNQPRRIVRNPGDRNGRGLSPIVVRDGRLCLLPGDSENYMEMDAHTGAIKFAVPARPTRAGAGGADLARWFLGVRGGKAWFQTQNSLFFLRLDSEKPDASSIFSLTTGINANVPCSGRGFLTEDRFFAPTDAGLVVYDVRNAKLIESCPWETGLRRLDSGHLVLVGNRLLCMNESGLVCFTDKESFDRSYAEVLAAEKPDPDKLEQHAEVLARNPRTWEGAVADYRRLVATCEDPARVVRARTRLMQLHKAQGDALLAKSPPDYAEAIRQYQLALEAAPADAALGDLFRILGECHEKLGQWADAVAMYQEVLEKYGERAVTAANGLTQPIRELARERIGKIVAEHGVEVYEQIEKKAMELFEELKSKDSIEELKKWWERFPNSRLGGEAAAELARRLSEAGRGAEAAEVWQRVAEGAPDRSEAAQAAASAAEGFAKAGRRDRAEGLLLRLERRHGDATVTIGGREGSVAEAAASIRALIPPDPAPAGRAQPGVWREWGTDPEDKAWYDAEVAKPTSPAAPFVQPGPRLLVPEGRWAGVDPSRVFFVARLSAVEARDAVTGDVLWSRWDPRGWLGVGWKTGAGSDDVQIGSVVPGTPADLAGFKPEDIPEFWNGVRIQGQDHMRRLICGSAGRQVEVSVRRGSKRETLRPVIGTRELRNINNDGPIRLVFTDGGLLLVVRASSVEALDPATGKPAWLHVPVYARDAVVRRIAVADGRVFLSWAPDPLRSQNRPVSADKDVPLEAIDAATGRQLWSYREDGCVVPCLFAPAGTGLVVKGEQRGAMWRLRILNAASGSEIRELVVSPVSGLSEPVAGVADGRLLYLREQNQLFVLDLHTGQESSRDLGGPQEHPSAFAVGGGHVALAYASAQRVVVVSVDPAAPRLVAPMPGGRAEGPGSLRIESGGRLFALVRPGGPSDPPELSLRRFDIRADALKELWRRKVSDAKVAGGADTSFGDHLVCWAAEKSDSQRGTIFWFKEGNLRLAWTVPVDGGEGAGGFREAGAQGPAIWARWDGKLILYR